MTCARSVLSIPQPFRQAPNLRHRRGLAETRALDSGSFTAEFQNARLTAAEARIAQLEAALQELQALASHDPLTAVCNRRGLAETFAREAARSRRSAAPLTLALIDLDDFKSINDCYGHAVGDRALQHLTGLIGETMRPTDSCSRLGGDEFVLLLPATDLRAARLALARLQQAIAAVPVAETPVLLKISVGLVAVAAGEPLEEALQRADKAVYRAKAQGKCCLMAA